MVSESRVPKGVLIYTNFFWTEDMHSSEMLSTMEPTMEHGCTVGWGGRGHRILLSSTRVH